MGMLPPYSEYSTEQTSECSFSGLQTGLKFTVGQQSSCECSIDLDPSDGTFTVESHETSPTSKIEVNYAVTMTDSKYFNDPVPSRTIKVVISIEAKNLVQNTTLLDET